MSVTVFFDPASGKIYSNTSEVGRLNYSERLVFEFLIKEKNKIVSKDDLLAAGWPGRVVVPNSLNIAIKSIRGTLERAGVHSEPETIPKMGYKLSADIICINSELELPQQRITDSKNDAVALSSEECCECTTTHSREKLFYLQKLHTIEDILKRASRFIFNNIYHYYVSGILLISVILYLTRLVAEPDIHCVEYGRLNFCGSHEISIKDIPSDFLKNKTEGTYWFTERDNEFTFFKVS
ncbi:TPA: winged helix-turn-helix domain-containing protein [Aeromonas veronii]